MKTTTHKTPRHMELMALGFFSEGDYQQHLRVLAAAKRLHEEQRLGSMRGGATIWNSEQYVSFKTAHSKIIKALADELICIDEDTHWSLIDEMKSYFASIAANACCDSREVQEKAVECAEQWVSDNCADGGILEDVAMAFWLYGEEAGRRYLEC